MKLRPYLQIARVDHWFKNLLVLPGTACAALLSQTPFAHYAGRLGLALLGLCLVASANYVLNEWLDKDFDRFHPDKMTRPSVVRDLNPIWVYGEYAILLALGLGLCALVSRQVAATAASLWIMGIAYNVRPLRTKERVYLDVLSESVNNPIDSHWAGTW